jgi:hypothetical protein
MLGECAGNVRVERDRPGWRAHHPTVPRAKVGERLHQVSYHAEAPRVYPLVEIGVDPSPGAARQRPQRATVQVHGLPEYRELFAIPYGEWGLHRAHGHRVANIVRYLVAHGRDTGISARRLGGALSRQLVCPFPVACPPRRHQSSTRPSTSSELRGHSAAAAGGPGSPGFPCPMRPTSAGACTPPMGDEAAVPPAEDVIRFARWRRETMHL